MISSARSKPLLDLLDYIERQRYEGYDPYDALNSPFLLKLKNKWLRVGSTILFRLSPINLRKLYRIEKGANPKGMGLLLSAYSALHLLGHDGALEKGNLLIDWMRKNEAPEYSGSCWGYNFPWQDRNRLLDKGIPTIVNTAYAGHGLLDYYSITKRQEVLDVARSACDFILEDLNIRETEQGICFSYNPVEKNIVHNANVLGASLLARVYAHTKEDVLLEHATKSFDFTVYHQRENGLWAYSQSPDTGKERLQTDWHQGFILDCLMWFIEAINPADEKYRKALFAGADFYKTQFTEEGIGYWRYPRRWPIDIHNQAQGIITFSKLEGFLPGSIQIAENIANWTLDNMRNKKRGYFYYEKWPLFTNRISYLRWAQAWMLLALATHISHFPTNRSHSFWNYD